MIGPCNKEKTRNRLYLVKNIELLLELFIWSLESLETDIKRSKEVFALLLLSLILTVLTMLVKAYQEDYQLKFRENQVEGPTSPRDYLEWNSRIRKWRLEQQAKRKEFSCSSTGYDVPSLQWAQKSYVQPNVMLHDLFLFDPVTNKYTVDKFLKGKDKRKIIPA